MVPCICSSSTSSISKFISEQPYLSLLETKCSTIKHLQIIHAQIIKTGLIKDTIAASRLLAFAATSSAADINYALTLFNHIQNPNIFTWNTIIRGFSRSSNPRMAISLFIEMLCNSVVDPDNLTYPSVFKAYAELGLCKNGAQLHGRVLKLGLLFDDYICNSIVHMYANCGCFGEAFEVFGDGEGMDVVAWNSMVISLAKFGRVDDARKVFDEMPERSLVSWNSMISGYVRAGKWVEALSLFRVMQAEKMKPCAFTLVSLLNALAQLGALKQGEWVHDYIKRNKVELNVILTTALINMYCKCGSVERAWEVFESSPVKGLSCWNSMIMGLAMHGRENEAIELFSRLDSPDDVSFIGVLTACNHSRSVGKAKHYFSLMKERYKIKPSIKHYGCMIDVLCRAGLLKEAETLIKSMPMKPDAVIWGSVLSSCRRYGDVKMGQWAYNNLLDLGVDESCGHVLLSNVYAAGGQFEMAIQERMLMKEKRIEKNPGCSLIEVDGEVHEFVAGGRLHPQVQEIHCLLENLTLMLHDINFHNP
ncbi:putative tetratricopeptide-like helical domain superfamily [Helianthus annuus]|uniref:Putative pentatricopeptide repeat (PPR-like) superfamily protein n=1 Tax=Helianthus annuus TaxID=4232 RepID=A0A251SCT5_HELAN|nr:pentatricopeptide repeat-containing protein At2g42920, chloroplastic [Helianthus annuus]KAF5766974.1 putative tetratricopeptide-like helical domain superfamily [Helianthus annuus]KAJ0453299.1 putative tetratricopeptide-like helical domain superfamily [Helianthus annuus]KAJ0475227.1 putative tetratricopeptide-like helical domain superfamily [Helianthus annuus]KAJ0654531.1 putative tetratricopeptide-like helical domain superfamily [Helianthus annuus]KAJ0847272.1 putative tetratricopeptide-lik